MTWLDYVLAAVVMYGALLVLVEGALVPWLDGDDEKFHPVKPEEEEEWSETP